MTNRSIMVHHTEVHDIKLYVWPPSKQEKLKEPVQLIFKTDKIEILILDYKFINNNILLYSHL